MSTQRDPNRERWVREAKEFSEEFWLLSDRESAEKGFLAACEKYAPRWVEVATKEHDDLIDAGWSWTFADGDGPIVLFFPPAPPPPGGEE